ncbi:hypothetical protein ACWDA7_23855, partial [Streptomyces sp. NPDC001156]
MGIETTAPNPQIIEQADALALLLSITQEFSHLPAGYLKIHEPMYSFGARIGIQLQSSATFEQWREALELPAADVKLHTSPQFVWLGACPGNGQSAGDRDGEIGGGCSLRACRGGWP